MRLLRPRVPTGPAVTWSKRRKPAAVTRIHGKLPLRIPDAAKLVKSAGSVLVAGVGAVEHRVQRETSLLRTLESTSAQM